MKNQDAKPIVVTARIADDVPSHEDADEERAEEAGEGAAATEPGPADPPASGADGMAADGEKVEHEAGATPDGGATDAFILDQAMLTAACELLPDRLALVAILPLQLRMVYSIGQRRGQAFDMSQVSDLAAALGIGAAGQVVEGVVRGVLGSVGRGLFGNLLGGAAGVAAGSAVTFATTYALGHAADQYYAQGRQLGASDLRALFTRFQAEASGIFPRMEARIREVASGTSVESLLAGLRS